MTTMRMASELAAVMVPIGYVGAAFAAVCAIIAAIAMIRGAGGLTGGAVGLWIVGALMSAAASFAREWTPLILAVAVLVAMLVIGGVVRAIITAAGVGRADDDVDTALPAPVPAAKTAGTTVKPALSTKAVTASIAVVR